MIFQRAALREFAQTFLAVFVALFAIMLTSQLIRLLGQAAGGKIVPEAVVALMGFGALNYLPTLLSLTLFTSVLLSLSRVWRDSEMVIWFSSGLPLTAWVKPVLRFALPMTFAISMLSLFLSPWAQSKSADYRNQMESRDDVGRVSPGAFKESAQAERVFFVEAMVDAAGNDTGRVKNVFISSVQQGRLGVMVAAGGHTEVATNGDRFLVLDKGRRYETTPGQAAYRIMEFDRYAVRVETKEARGVERAPSHLPVWELIAQPTPAHLGELLWRLGLPLSALTLALLAIPLSFVNPRAGRTNNLLFALLTFMIYSNLMSVSRAWVAQSKLSFGIGVWAVHALMFLLMLALFYHRIVPNSHSRQAPPPCLMKSVKCD